MADFHISRLAIPFSFILVSFLAYSSQLLFRYIEPGPLSNIEFLYFNALVGCVWVCYTRSCFVNPGEVPKDWQPQEPTGSGRKLRPRPRWCRKCSAFKPPRSHHCKTCGRCVPKMDHHCPWTNNCVSHFTMPHFFRFLTYGIASGICLEYFLVQRGAILWEKRNLPSYLGPSAWQLVHLFALMAINTINLLLITILWLRTGWCIAANTTTIETWEIERHDRLVRRARTLGGYLDGPDGTKIRIRKQEFPYDIGIFQNIKQNLGGSNNVIGWFWPFAASPPRASGLDFEVNEFEDPGTSWPPTDPDRIPRQPRPSSNDDPFVYNQNRLSREEEIAAFKERQRQEMERRDQATRRRRPFHERYGTSGREAVEVESNDDDLGGFEDDDGSNSGEEGWRSPSGDRLRDYGVDEDAEFYDEEDLPLAELIRRRKSEARQ